MCELYAPSLGCTPSLQWSLTCLSHVGRFQNILISASGEAKISDFGIARGLERTGQQARTFVGTLMYMAPERIVSRGYSYQSDVWSLGLSILTAALGRFPFSTSSGYWGLARVIRDEQPQVLPREFSDHMRSFVDQVRPPSPIDTL